MASETANRQDSAPRESRNVPWNCKLTRTEITALTLVAAHRGVTVQDLLRERFLEAVVTEYHELRAKLAEAS
jgi:hypothetical protein